MRLLCDRPYLIRSRLFRALGVPAKRCPILHTWAVVENHKFCHAFTGEMLCREGSEKAVRLGVGRELDALSRFLKTSPYQMGTIKRGGGKDKAITFYGAFAPNRAVSWIQDQLRGLTCKNPGKHPIMKGWQQIATTYEPSLLLFWDRHPFANVGIATGKRWKNGEFLSVMDCDHRHFGHGSISHLERNELCPLPPTREHGRGGGPHRFYTYPEGFHSMPGALGQGIDVQSFGKLVIAPGSTHVSGRLYEVTIDLPISRLPDVWAERIKAESSKRLSLIPEGKRHEWLMKCAGGMIGGGIPPDLALETLKDRRDRRCEKGTHWFSDDDLKRMIHYCQQQERLKKAEEAA